MNRTQEDIVILAIESSCDDTSAAVLCNRSVLSNAVANQLIHARYGGIVPELASRDHQRNITLVVDEALQKANLSLTRINAIAFTRGPGLLGSLLVGASFAKSLALAMNIPLIEVNHMQAHVLSHFIEGQETRDEGQMTMNEMQAGDEQPEFPFLCLTISGGHTQLVKVKDPYHFELLGQTLDDAVGEAFDKGAKILGLSYPGGPLIDRYAKKGDKHRFKFPISNMPGFDYSFSGIKTAFLYFIRDEKEKDPAFVEKNLSDICASYQWGLSEILFKKFLAAAAEHKIRTLALAGGVSANSLMRERIDLLKEKGYKVFIPPFEYCTDNAAMIGITGYFKYLKKDFCSLNSVPTAQYNL